MREKIRSVTKCKVTHAELTWGIIPEAYIHWFVSVCLNVSVVLVLNKSALSSCIGLNSARLSCSWNPPFASSRQVVVGLEIELPMQDFSQLRQWMWVNNYCCSGPEISWSRIQKTCPHVCHTTVQFPSVSHVCRPDFARLRILIVNTTPQTQVRIIDNWRTKTLVSGRVSEKCHKLRSLGESWAWDQAASMVTDLSTCPLGVSHNGTHISRKQWRRTLLFLHELGSHLWSATTRQLYIWGFWNKRQKHILCCSSPPKWRPGLTLQVRTRGQ